MSWFKRSPRRNEPLKPHVYHPPHPATAKRPLEESKEIATVKKNKKVK